MLDVKVLVIDGLLTARTGRGPQRKLNEPDHIMAVCNERRDFENFVTYVYKSNSILEVHLL